MSKGGYKRLRLKHHKTKEDFLLNKYKIRASQQNAQRLSYLDVLKSEKFLSLSGQTKEARKIYKVKSDDKLAPAKNVKIFKKRKLKKSNYYFAGARSKGSSSEYYINDYSSNLYKMS